MEDLRIVRKILRSLPERFQPKVISIKKKKSKDLDNICRVEELVGSLQTNKSTLSYQKKGKSIALKYVKKERVYSFDNDINSEDISLVDRKFRKFMFKKKNNIKDNRGKDFAKRNESKNDI